LQAIAAGFQHFAALAVVAGAGDAAAVAGAFARALFAAKIEIADLLAVFHAAASAVAIAQCLTKALQLSTIRVFIAAAANAETALTLLEHEFALHCL